MLIGPTVLKICQSKHENTFWFTYTCVITLSKKSLVVCKHLWQHLNGYASPVGLVLHNFSYTYDQTAQVSCQRIMNMHLSIYVRLGQSRQKMKNGCYLPGRSARIQRKPVLRYLRDTILILHG